MQQQPDDPRWARVVAELEPHVVAEATRKTRIRDWWSYLIAEAWVYIALPISQNSLAFYQSLAFFMKHIRGGVDAEYKRLYRAEEKRRKTLHIAELFGEDHLGLAAEPTSEKFFKKIFRKRG
jgi:hypothetical protein